MNDSTKSEQIASAKTWDLFRFGIIGCLALAAFVAGTLQPWNLAKDDETQLDSETTDRAISVVTLTARQTAICEITKTYTGIIKAGRESELAFGRSGRLARVLVAPSQQVRAGDVLAELEIQRLVDQKTKLDAALNQANSELARLIAVVRLPTIQAIQSEIRSLRSQLNRLQARVTGNALQPDLNTAEQRLESLEAVTRDERVAAQQSIVEELNAKLAELQVAIEESKLKAPFDGTMVRRYLDDGAMISPGRPVVKIVDLSELHLRVGIPQDQAFEMEKGESHIVQIGGRNINATLLWKSPVVERTTRTCTAVFALGKSDALDIFPGQVGRLELKEIIDGEGFWLPISALIRESSGLWSVYVTETEEDGKQLVSRRIVEVIHQDVERVRVRGTLDDGDLVIADGTHRVVPGQEVMTQSASLPVQVENGDSERSL